MKHLLRYILVFILTLGAAGTYVCSAGENAPLSGMISLAAAAPAEEKVTMEAAVGYGGAAKTILQDLQSRGSIQRHGTGV